MATMCSGCPAIRACSDLAQRMEADAPRSVAGVWGGEWYRDGQIIDPWGDDHDDMRSVYKYVWFDRERGSWRAERVVGGRRHYIASKATESAAGEAAYDWSVEHGIDW